MIWKAENQTVFLKAQNSIRNLKTNDNNDKLKNGHWLLWSIHILISLSFWLSYKYELVSLHLLTTGVIFYFWMVPGLLLMTYYRQLRDYKVYLLWLITGIIQAVIYFIAKDNSDFHAPKGNYLASLRTLFIMLVSFQLFRQLFRLLTPWELIITAKRFTSHDWDDNRKLIWLDYLFSLIIGIIMIVSLF